MAWLYNAGLTFSFRAEGLDEAARIRREVEQLVADHLGERRDGHFGWGGIFGGVESDPSNLGGKRRSLSGT